MLKVLRPDPAANFLESVPDVKRLSAFAADRVQSASLETSGAIRAFKMGNEHGGITNYKKNRDRSLVLFRSQESEFSSQSSNNCWCT